MGHKANFAVHGATCSLCFDKIQMCIECLDQAIVVRDQN